ncbi:hypothetical protein KI387_006182, partial [Taxus chinensis]
MSEKSFSSLANQLLYTDDTKLLEDERKRHRRIRSERTLHFIPFLLILCAFILWIATGSDMDYSIDGE